MCLSTLEIGAATLRYRNHAEITAILCEQKPYPVWFSCRRKSYPVLCENGLRRVHTEHVTTTTRNLPSWQSQGTDECCDSWLVLSPDRSFLGGSFPTGKQAQAPNDDKWNPLQTGNKGKTLAEINFSRAQFHLTGRIHLQALKLHLNTGNPSPWKKT